jgi:prepilin signal peptidase PulO-like enzyme (type II secretory pathway)
VLLARLIFSTGRSPAFAVAALAGGLAFLAINLVSGPAMGMGDVKLVAFIGAGLGFGVVGAVVIAFLALFPFALGALARGGLAARKKTLPFGPFLAFGAIVVLLLPHVLGHAAT